MTEVITTLAYRITDACVLIVMPSKELPTSGGHDNAAWERQYQEDARLIANWIGKVIPGKTIGYLIQELDMWKRG